jgi:signal transduction histidine kinase
MFERRSLRLPITLGVVMIVLVVLLLIGWIFLSILSAIRSPDGSGIYWALLSVGATFLALVLLGVVMYLVLSIKAVNLSRRQSNFIDSVTHELKSPIASLKLYLQTLNRRQVSPEEQASFYKTMLEDVSRLDDLINHLLDAARLEKDRTPAEAVDVDLAAVLRSTAEIVCQRYQTPPGVVELDLQPCTVHAAPVDLELIFRNLIDNAIKYASDENPQVEVSLRPASDGRVVARISDNGRGIPPQYRRKLFSRFMRLGLELERAKPGTGLGLYIVRTLVQRLGGTVRIRDREGGSGTTFEVQLPGEKIETPAAAQHDREATESTQDVIAAARS